MRLAPPIRWLVVGSLLSGIALWGTAALGLMSMARFAERLVGSVWIVVGMSLLALACAACFDRERVSSLE